MSDTAKKWVSFLGFVAAPVLVGVLSSLLSGDIRGTYEGFVQPPLSPPGWLFGIVWPVLYILMGLAAWLVFRSQALAREKRLALGVFVAQLLVNFSWSIVFFRASNHWAGLVVIIVLDILVIACLALFWRLRRVAGLLLVPYLLWILFATYLTLAVAMLN